MTTSIEAKLFQIKLSISCILTLVYEFITIKTQSYNQNDILKWKIPFGCTL